VRDLVELLNPRREVDSSDACAWAGEGAKKYLLYHNNDYFWRQSKEPQFTINSKTAPDHPSANSCCLQIELLAASVDFAL
jgi:hypothetical protein